MLQAPCINCSVLSSQYCFSAILPLQTLFYYFLPLLYLHLLQPGEPRLSLSRCWSGHWAGTAFISAQGKEVNSLLYSQREGIAHTTAVVFCTLNLCRSFFGFVSVELYLLQVRHKQLCPKAFISFMKLLPSKSVLVSGLEIRNNCMKTSRTL